MYLSPTCDGTEVQKDVSYTPFTTKILNLTSGLRSLAGNIKLHAVFPPHIKDYNGLLLPIAEEFEKLRPGGGNPIPIDHPETNELMHLYVHLAYFVNDLRGAANCTGGHQTPAYVGACSICNIGGVRSHGTQQYPSSVRALPRNHALRATWKEEFKHVPKLADLAGLGTPGKRNKKDAIASGMRTETKASPEAFKSVSSFTKILPYHDPTKHAFADNAHTLANFVKQVTGMIGDLARKGTRIFRAKHRKNELKTKRFAYMKSQAGTAPVRPKWQATKARVKLIEDAQALCKRPKEWPSLGPMFSKEVKKTSELLLCAGPVGAYYLQYVDIDDDIKANMIKVFRLMGILQHKCSTSGDRSKVRKELPIAMTELELRVPTYNQTMVVHVLVSHMVDMLEATGPFHVGNMLDMERYS